MAQIAGEAYWQRQLRTGAFKKNFNFRVAQYALAQRHGVTETRKLLHNRWLNTKDLVGSLDTLLKMYECEEIGNDEVKVALEHLNSLADLKTKTELEARLAEIEERLKL